MRELELYVHIPFCVKKCDYCDFLSMPADESVRRHYVGQLLEEIRQNAPVCKEYQVSSVFFGGGTPSLLSGGQTAEIMEELQERFQVRQNAEITLECNPGTLTRQKLALYKTAGVNRLSLGLQSADHRELQKIGRIHTFEEFLESFDLARKAGFSNINVDVMSALPGQRTKDWLYTLKKVLELRPEHISAYSLIVEEGTPFYERYGEDELRRQRGEVCRDLPSEETERQMYELTREILADHGYLRYEISNYAKPGRECRHNIGYWQLTPYLGLGLGSSSYLEQARFSNTRKLEEYLKGNWNDLAEILETVERQKGRADVSCGQGELVMLDKRAQMEEFMFLGLRMTAGIARKKFQKLFGVELEGVYGEILRKLQRQGLIEQSEGRVFLTEEGISVSNYVLSEFLLEVETSSSE
ncbi:MAG: oxygen-independent coproporphyrinogen III oxidase [Lachnospiraceae bacterium]|nr:oxygen-independent coproporphyrinogen III oxidase [Lachnospiraceae bacterium]